MHETPRHRSKLPWKDASGTQAFPEFFAVSRKMGVETVPPETGYTAT